MEYADRGNLADALRSGRFPCCDFVAVYRCLLDIAAGTAQLLPSAMPLLLHQNQQVPAECVEAAQVRVSIAAEVHHH